MEARVWVGARVSDRAHTGVYAHTHTTTMAVCVGVSPTVSTAQSIARATFKRFDADTDGYLTPLVG